MKHTLSYRLGKTLLLALLVIGLGAACSPVISAQRAPISNSLNTPAVSTATYPIVDTGQTRCYGSSTEIVCPLSGQAFYGQDSQVAGHQPSYTDHGDGTVTDNVSGLMWQQSPDTDADSDIDAADKLTYAEAGTYCQNLTLAGHTDWRLPEIKTLYSLIDFSGGDPSGYSGTDTSGLTPFIDTDYFDFAYGDTAAGERIIDSQYASSTLYVANTGNDGGSTLFGVNFADGRIKGYGLTMPGPGNVEKTFFVQCVRGDIGYGQNVFTGNGDGAITDSATGLVWSQNDSGTGLNWEEALAWVETQNAANYLGYDDWRLPDAKELQSIVDYTRSPDTTGSAAIDSLFNATAITNEAGASDYPSYWSSTTHANWTASPGAAAAYTAFGRAMGYMQGSWIDVHGAGAQRSDPKEGDPADFPTGRGPQGDAIRIYNYVRLVRDAETAAGSNTFLPVILALDGEDVVLAWAENEIAVDSYRVQWSDRPYFVSGDAGVDQTSILASPYVDTGANGVSRYYTITGLDENGQTVRVSNRVGAFHFPLAAGASYASSSGERSAA